MSRYEKLDGRVYLISGRDGAGVLEDEVKVDCREAECGLTVHCCMVVDGSLVDVVPTGV